MTNNEIFKKILFFTDLGKREDLLQRLIFEFSGQQVSKSQVRSWRSDEFRADGSKNRRFGNCPDHIVEVMFKILFIIKDEKNNVKTLNFSEIFEYYLTDAE